MTQENKAIKLPFEKGEKIICIDEDPDGRKNSLLGEEIFLNEEYTVRECDCDEWGEDWYVKIEGFDTEWEIDTFKKSKN